MYYVLSFVVLIIIQWVLFMYFMNSDIGKSIATSVNTREVAKKIWTRRYCALICAEMILFSGFRAFDVGVDTSVYLNALVYYSNLPHNEILSAKLVYPFDFEIGYFFFTKICAYLNFNRTMFLLVVAALTYIPIFIFIEKYSKIPLISILTYFAFGLFAYSLGIFRQMIALSLCLCAVPYIKKKKLIVYLLICGFAGLFHLTALMMIPFYFLRYVDLNKRRTIYFSSVLAIELFCFIFARDIILVILKFFGNYAGYIGGKYDVQGGTYLNLVYLNVLLFLGMFAVTSHVDKEDTLSVKGIAIACIIQSCSYAMGIMGRLVCYFSVYEMLLIPLIVENLFNEKTVDDIALLPRVKEHGLRKKAMLEIAAVFMLFLLVFWVTHNDAVLQDYRFIWS